MPVSLPRYAGAFLSSSPIKKIIEIQSKCSTTSISGQISCVCFWYNISKYVLVKICISLSESSCDVNGRAIECRYMNLERIGRGGIQISIENLGRLSILQGSDFLLLFEDILEIGLGGEAEVTADFAETFIRIGQQALGFLQLTAHDERGDFKSKFLLELFGQIGAGLMDGLGDISHANGLTDIS